MASSRSYDISKFNTKIRLLVDKNAQATKSLYCSNCDVLIKSNNRTSCSACGGVLHKKCIISHCCTGSKPEMSISSQSKIQSNLPPARSDDNIVAIPGPSRLSMAAVSNNTSDNIQIFASDINSIDPPPTQNHEVSDDSLCVLTNSITSTLNPRASSFVPPNSSQKSPLKRKKKLPKQNSQTTQLQFDFEFQTVQLNTAKAMILELESEKKKLQQSKALLEDRIKLFESEKQRLSQEMPGKNRFTPCAANHAYSQCHRLYTCNCRQPEYLSDHTNDDFTHAILNIDIKMNSLATNIRDT